MFNPELPDFTQNMSMPVNGPKALMRENNVERISSSSQSEFQELRIYPNPARETITFDWQPADNERGFVLTVYNGWGKLVYSIPNPHTPVTLDTRKLGKGLFVAVLEQYNKQIQSRKFIIVE